MSDEIPDALKLALLAIQRTQEAQQREREDIEAFLAIGLTAITTLIDAGQITSEEAARRIEQTLVWIQPDPALRVDNRAVQFAVQFLRSDNSQPPPRFRPYLVQHRDDAE